MHLVGNKIADHSDVVGAAPVGAAPTTTLFSTWHLAAMDWAETTARLDEKHLSVEIWFTLYYRFDDNCSANCRGAIGGICDKVVSFSLKTLISIKHL